MLKFAKWQKICFRRQKLVGDLEGILDRKLIQLLSEIKESEWDKLILNLTRYAFYEMERKYWKYERVPKGLTAEDIALESISDLLEGIRKWDYTNQPNLLNFLRSAVDSKISHLFEMKDYNLIERFPVTEDDQEREELMKKADPVSEHACFSPADPQNPEETLIQKQVSERDKAAVSALFEAVKGDDQLENLFMLIMDGYMKPSEIAEEMKIDVKEVNNLQKRLRRKFKKLRSNTKPKEKL